ncbi:MAG TPA: hypothetical protein VFI81_07285, partial [Rhodanobacteraceae bacterium]|nr:hypothetical protein [Rhodanobacteraceae bacterium]
MKLKASSTIAALVIIFGAPIPSTASARCVPAPRSLVKALASSNDGNAGPYIAALVDLNGDGSPEAVVFRTGGGMCGTGGCNLTVFQRRGDTWYPVGGAGIANPPVRVLRQRTDGWASLSVVQRGGSTSPGITEILQFNGSWYSASHQAAPSFLARHKNVPAIIGAGRCARGGVRVLPNTALKPTSNRSAV